MKVLRKALFWAHLVTGVFVALVVLIMSVTGVLLTYQRQITAWADTRGLDASPPSPSSRPLSVDSLLARVGAEVPGKPTSVRWHAAPDKPVEVAFGRERTLFVNAYTGEVLGEGSVRVRAFFRTMVAWHRWLGAEGEHRKLARAITGASNLGFLFLVVSGFFLWWPRNWTWQTFRSVLFFRRGLSGKARDFNWHHVIGFWSLVPLVIVVLSGVVISYRWASDLVYRAVGEEPPAVAARGGRGGAGAPGRGGAGGTGQAAEPIPLGHLEALRRRAEEQVAGWRSITLQLPGLPEAPVNFTIDRGDGGQPQKRIQVAFDAATGEVVRWEPFSSNTPGRRLRSILRFAHTGEVAGLLGQTIAGLVSLGGAILVWTGLALTWRRFLKWRERRADGRASLRRGASDPSRELAAAESPIMH